MRDAAVPAGILIQGACPHDCGATLLFIKKKKAGTLDRFRPRKAGCLLLTLTLCGVFLPGMQGQVFHRLDQGIAFLCQAIADS